MLQALSRWESILPPVALWQIYFLFSKPVVCSILRGNLTLLCITLSPLCAPGFHKESEWSCFRQVFDSTWRYKAMSRFQKQQVIGFRFTSSVLSTGSVFPEFAHERMKHAGKLNVSLSFFLLETELLSWSN